MGFWYLWGFFSGLLMLLGVTDNLIHRHYLRKISVRVNVNGTRGKSTVTRLITGALREADLAVVGKTTGTAARMIFWDTDEEVPIERRSKYPTINEQCKVVRMAARHGADYLISECMAVKPEYQTVFARQLLRNNIGVIVNTLPDHLDVMGPTTKEVAEALSATIPENGLLVTIRDEFAEFYQQIADKRHTRVLMADPDNVSPAYLSQFPFLVFPENVALALEVALALGIEREVALRGMLKAPPDPGVLTVTPLRLNGKELYFANAFAANDPVSTMLIYERLEKIGYHQYPLVVIVNCREDRVDRTKQMAKDVLPKLPCTHLIAVGSATQPIKSGYSKGLFPCEIFWNLEEVPVNNIVAQLEELPAESLIFGIGNIHGTAEELLQCFQEKQSAENYSFEWREKLVHI